MDKKIDANRYIKIIWLQTTCIFLSIFSFGDIYSQDFKIAGITYSRFSKSRMKHVKENQKTSFNELGAFINIPKIFKKDSLIIINGLGYDYVQATMYSYPALKTNIYQKNLHAIYYRLVSLYKYNKKWAFLVSLKPKLASEVNQKLSLKAFVFQGTVMAMKNVNENFKYGFGIINNTGWGTPTILPAVNLRYTNNRHSLNAILPLRMKYTYSFLSNKELKIGLLCNWKGANYNISENDVFQITKINQLKGNIASLINYKVTKMLQLELNTNVSASRKYFLADSQKKYFDSKLAPFVTVGISVVPPKRS